MYEILDLGFLECIKLIQQILVQKLSAARLQLVAATVWNELIYLRPILQASLIRARQPTQRVCGEKGKGPRSTM